MSTLWQNLSTWWIVLLLSKLLLLLQKNWKGTRQVSSMIHSARPTVSPVANIVFVWYLFCFEKWGRTYVRTICAKTMITTDRDRGSASWINKPLSTFYLWPFVSFQHSLNFLAHSIDLIDVLKSNKRAVLVANKRNVTTKLIKHALNYGKS